MLSPDFEQRVAEEIGKGAYASTNELVCESLHLLFADLLKALAYIADRDIAAAAHFRARVYDSVTLLAKHPQAGHRRPDLAGPESDLHFWPLDACLVIYRASRQELKILRVLSGYCDIAALLTSRRTGS